MLCLGELPARDFLAPRHTLTGDGSSRRIGEALTSWMVPTGRAMIVTDRAVADAGLIDGAAGSLRAGGWTVGVFADISGEPTIDDAERLTAEVRREPVTVIVGIGGGSAMDLAKVAALLATNTGDVRGHIGIELPEEPPAPLVLIPTTTGTGSEATRIAMLADDDGKAIIGHRFLVPLVAVLDPSLVLRLPGAITASTGLDALAHAVEAFMSTSRTMFTTSASLQAASTLHTWLRVAYADPGRHEARRATLYGSHMAGLALNAGVVLGHSMAYTIANRTHLPHGVTCAMALPYCIAFNAAAELDGADLMARAITGGRSDEWVAAVGWVEETCELLGMPDGPVSVGIAADQARPMAVECVDRYPRPTNPVPMTLERVAPLYEAFFASDLAAAWSR